MKVTVNKYLNARIGEATTNAACNFYHSPGDTIEIDDVLVGTEIDGNSIWYHCKDDGCFYWSGGITEVDFKLSSKTLTDQDYVRIIGSIKNDVTFFLSKKVIGYKGIGIGYKNGIKSLGICLVVFVDIKTTFITTANNPIPKSILYRGIEIPTDVKPVHNPTTHQYDQSAQAFALLSDNKPIGVGGSISQKNKPNFGTRTVNVKKRNSTDNYVMTCYHVLFFDTLNDSNDHFYKDAPRNSLNAIFPSPNKNPSFPATDHIILEGEISGFYDYALVRLNNVLEVNNLINGSFINNFVRREEIDNMIGSAVTAVSAYSYLQTGLIREIRSDDITIECNKKPRKYFNVIVSDQISIPGDSGAPVITSDKKLLGYVIGGNQSDVTYILPFYLLVLNKDILL